MPPKRQALARAAAGVGLLVGSWLALRRDDLQRADVRVGDVLRRAGSPGIDRVVTQTTDLGSVYAVGGMAAVLAASGRRRLAADVLGVGLAAWAVAQSSKTGVRRQRPYEADGTRRLIRPPTGSSFPSGHAAVSAAVSGLLTDHARGPRSRALWHVLAGYVAASRVYVGVHYPSDVLGGAGMGLLVASVWRGPVAAVGRGLVSGAMRIAAGPLARRRPSAPPATAPRG
jgi:membrane-associated phospholipid phosphatase